MDQDVAVVSGVDLVCAGAVPVSASEMAEFGLGVASAALVDDDEALLGEGGNHG